MMAGTITVYAAYTAKASTVNRSLDAGVTLQAYTYIDESGFGKHIAKGTGTLMGEYKAAAGKFRVEVYYGKYEPEKKAHATKNIGYYYNDYSESCVKTGWFLLYIVISISMVTIIRKIYWCIQKVTIKNGVFGLG